MTVDDKIRDENFNMILTEKLQKYQHYHLEKFVHMNILQVMKYFSSNQRKIIEQANFACSHLGKALEDKQKNN